MSPQHKSCSAALFGGKGERGVEGFCSRVEERMVRSTKGFVPVFQAQMCDAFSPTHVLYVSNSHSRLELQSACISLLTAYAFIVGMYK